MAWDEIGERVFRRRYPSLDLNVGAILGEDEVLVVDTRGCDLEAGELLDDLRALTALPCRQVVNTHGHFDHCFGNAWLRPDAIWGHPGCAEHLRTRVAQERASQRRWLPGAGQVTIVPPDRLVAGHATVVVGGRHLDLYHPGRGHTDHDLVVHVPDAAVVFAGDLVEEGAPPSYDDAFPLDWPTAVDRVLALEPATIVPGHGDVVDPGFAHHQRRALASMADLCHQVRTGAMTANEAVWHAPFPEASARTALRRGGVSDLRHGKRAG